jgi:hypothetical protein
VERELIDCMERTSHQTAKGASSGGIYRCGWVVSRSRDICPLSVAHSGQSTQLLSLRYPIRSCAIVALLHDTHALCVCQPLLGPMMQAPHLLQCHKRQKLADSHASTSPSHSNNATRVRSQCSFPSTCTSTLNTPHHTTVPCATHDALSSALPPPHHRASKPAATPDSSVVRLHQRVAVLQLHHHLLQLLT